MKKVKVWKFTPPLLADVFQGSNSERLLKSIFMLDFVFFELNLSHIQVFIFISFPSSSLWNGSYYSYHFNFYKLHSIFDDTVGIQNSTTTCLTWASDGLVGKTSDSNVRDPGSIPESTFRLNNILYPTNTVDAQSNGSSLIHECPLNVGVISHTMWMPTSRGRSFNPQKYQILTDTNYRFQIAHDLKSETKYSIIILPSIT